LINRSVQAAVFENSSRDHPRAKVWPMTAAPVGVVTDISWHRLIWQTFDIHRCGADRSKCARTQVDVVLRDRRGCAECRPIRRWLELAELCDGEVIFYARGRRQRRDRRRTARNEGRAVFVRRRQGCAGCESAPSRLAVAACRCRRLEPAEAAEPRNG